MTPILPTCLLYAEGLVVGGVTVGGRGRGRWSWYSATCASTLSTTSSSGLVEWEACPTIPLVAEDHNHVPPSGCASTSREWNWAHSKLKVTHIQKARSPELWWAWGTWPSPELWWTWGTFAELGEVLVNVALWVCQSSSNCTRPRQSLREGTRMLLVLPGTPWSKSEQRCKKLLETSSHHRHSRGDNSWPVDIWKVQNISTRKSGAESQRRDKWIFPDLSTFYAEALTRAVLPHNSKPMPHPDTTPLRTSLPSVSKILFWDIRVATLEHFAPST